LIACGEVRETSEHELLLAPSTALSFLFGPSPRGRGKKNGRITKLEHKINSVEGINRDDVNGPEALREPCTSVAEDLNYS
jgi:hypothetical protein